VCLTQDEARHEEALHMEVLPFMWARQAGVFGRSCVSEFVRGAYGGPKEYWKKWYLAEEAKRYDEWTAWV
jgi:hypothetical protein